MQSFYNTSSGTVKQLSEEIVSIEHENILLRLILASCTDPILITDRKCNIIYVNPAWELLTGYTFDEVKDKNPRLLKSGKTPTRVYRNMWRALNDNQAFTTEETIDRRKDGTEYQIYSTFYPVQKDDFLIYYVQIMHDITHRKQLENLRKGFLNIAAHELKTPITVLTLLTQAHISRVNLRKNMVTNLNEWKLIDRELARLTTLINDILDSSRFETGKISMQFKNINISELIYETVGTIGTYMKEHIFIISDIPKNLVLHVDPNRIRQVLFNLLTNAAKYSDKGSTIKVYSKITKKHVTFVVKDQGIGISATRHKHIFTKYYQVKENDGKGFGLGLYIAKEIIKRHHGKIWVESEIGKGCKFYFSLPLRDHSV